MKKRGKQLLAFLLVFIMSMAVGLDTMAAYVYDEDENRYVYNETDAASVDIAVTVSYDGIPILGQDENNTILSGLSVTIPYFDLANYNDYGLDKYYRYPILSDGSYDVSGPENVVKRPTTFHAVIYLLERYYLGVPEEECGTGKHEEALFDTSGEEKTIKNVFGEDAYQSETRAALDVNGDARSLYMTNFWGHSENLNYYLNHEYPLDRPGWGSTCDYMTLEDGDIIDIAMFSNWDFYSMKNSGFSYFENDEYTIKVGEPFVIENIKRAEKGVVDGATSVIENDAFDLYDFYVIDPDGNTEDKMEDIESGIASISFDCFDQVGTYYVYAIDTNGNTNGETSDVCRAPAVAKVNVVNDMNLSSITAPASITGVKNGTDMTEEALGLPTKTKVKTDTDYVANVDITWDLSNVEYNPESVAAQTFTVKGNVELPSYIMANGISTEVQVTVSVNEAEVLTTVRNLIDAIGTVTYTGDSKAKIDAARQAYDALTSEGKELVAAKLSILTKAEATYTELKAEAEAAEAAKKKAEEEAKKKAEEEAKKKAAEEAAKKEEEAKKKAEAEAAAKKAAEIAAAKKTVQETTIAKLKAKAKGSTGITLSWNKNTKVAGYEVWRSTKANSNYSCVKTITKNSTNSYTLNKGLKKSTTYYYRVRGYKVINGEKVYTPYTRIVVNLNKTKAIKAISVADTSYTTSKKKVTLTWGGHESMYSLKGYKIYQSTKSNKGFKAVKTTSGKKVTISKGLKKGKTYYFKIRGYAKVGKKTVYTKYSKVIKVKVK